MMMRTQILLARKDVVYLVKAMSHYSDNEMLVIPFNTGNHWLLLPISTTYDRVWYCDSSRPTYPKIGDQLTHNFNDAMSALDK
jgi:hypothetical protein